MNSQITEVLKIEAGSLQEFLEKLLVALASPDVIDVAISSPRILAPQIQEVICSAFNRSPGAKSASTHTSRTRVEWDISPFKDGSLVLSISSCHSFEIEETFKLAIRSKIGEVLSAKRTKLRQLIIEQSVRSKDMNSFLHRALASVSASFLYAEEISAFLTEPSSQGLYLAASTASIDLVRANGKRERQSKKNVVYTLEDKTNTVLSFLENKEMFENHRTGFGVDDLQPVLKTLPIFSKAFWPISIALPERDERGPHPERNILGVLRFSNIFRRGPSGAWESEFTDYDRHVIEFFSEIIFVLVQKYLQFVSSKTDYARLTHGLGANLDAAHKFALSVRDTLFDEGETFHTAKYFPKAPNPEEERSLYLQLKDLLHFIEDLQFQFQKVTGGEIQVVTEAERIDNVHAEVLMPALRLADGISAANQKNIVPQFSNLIDRGSTFLSAIAGSRNAYISVLRNLIENSVKYTRGECRITLGFSETRDHVIIDYFDTGIGIKPSDIGRIFVEGYRSKEARRISNRGIGVGLSYSQDVMRMMEGDLVCLEHAGGAHFRLLIRKAK